jgi:putative two-component system response regulator
LQRHNERLEETVRLRTLQIHQAHRDALAKLAIASEFRDDDTGEHTKRVGSIAAQIARIMGLPKSFVDDIRVAAPLHDVGKIGIPDVILQKPSALTAEEYARVREHAKIGEQILRGADEPIVEMACDVALTHHERWDGGGYPAGLAGEDIPISGRIVAVADAFDAMTNDRHYRKAISVEMAVVELKACSGSHFDPTVVEAFVHIIDRGLQVDPEPNGRRAASVPQYRLFSE